MTTLFERLENNAARHPNKAAFIYLDKQNRKTITFQNLLDSTNRFAHALQYLGARANMRAALMTPPSADFFPCVFALLKLGIVPVMVDPAIGLKKLSECLNASQPELFIGNTATHLLRKFFKWGKNSIKINVSIHSLKELSHNTHSKIQNTEFRILDSSPAAIIFTSGSTGAPKGVLYTQANFSAQLDMLVETFHITQDEIDLPAFPLYAMIDALLGITSIIPDITFPVPKNINAAHTLSAILEYKVTNTFASPVVLDNLAEYGIKHNIKLPSLKRVITAGAPAPTHLQEKFRKLLVNETDLFGIYGATEVLPIAIVESREIFANAQNLTAKGAGVCLGKPVNGANVRVIQISDLAIPQFSEVLIQPVNLVGEITVKGKSVTQSYIARAEANQLAKIQEGAEVVHRMGDAGYFDEQGRLWYCGRKSHRVITKDDILFTEQIEGIFNAHPLVYRSALVCVNQEPVLWIEIQKHTRHATKENIKNELMLLAKDHPQASKIKKFLFSKKFPTDVRHNSKIIREKLTELAK